jgi:hypothetical protein
MPRERLPDRRQAETLNLWHGGRRYHVTVGEYPDGRPGEVFIHGAKPGSDADLLNDDIGVLISRLLQHGDSPAALAAGIGRLGVPGFIRNTVIDDPVTGQQIEIRVCALDTRLTIDGRDYYFGRFSGKLEGAGMGCVSRSSRCISAPTP